MSSDPDTPPRTDATADEWEERNGSPDSVDGWAETADERGEDAEGVGDSPTTEPTLDPDRYLLAGEDLSVRVDAGRGWVAVTSHRILVYDPEREGKHFETVDRPNVVGVRTSGGGDQRLLGYLRRAAAYAVVLLGGGFVARSLGLRTLFAPATAVGDAPGIGGLVSMLSLIGALVGLAVDLLVVGGVVCALVALGLAVWYLRDRHPTLVVERAGEEDLSVGLPTAAAGERAVADIERALADELAVARATDREREVRPGRL